MDLSIIIVNYNVKHFIEQCLHSVYKAAGELTTEVIVVDNNSVDDSCAMIKQKFPQVNLIENKDNTGFSRANNQGLKIAKGKYVLLLNPDTVIQEDTLVKCFRFMEKTPDAGALGVKMIDGKGRFLPESKRSLPTPMVSFYKVFGFSALFPKSKRFGKYHLGYLDKDKIHKVDVLSGAFMFMRMQVFEKTPFLDETFFMYGEDIDLSYRIQLAGYDNYYFPDTTIIHYKGESTKKGSINYVLIFYKAMIIFARKHFSKKNAFFYTFLIYLAIYLRASISILNRIFRKLFLPLTDMAGLFLVLYFTAQKYGVLKFQTENYYPEAFFKFGIPSYIALCLLGLYFFGAYEKKIKYSAIINGIGVSGLVTAVLYALLPEELRFSRAVLIIGIGVSFFMPFVNRYIASVIFKDVRLLHKHALTRLLLIGGDEEILRVEQVLKESTENITIVGYIRTERDISHIVEENLATINEKIQVNKVDELVFCSKDISAEVIMETMLSVDDMNIDFKIAPPESVTVIGSNSINTAGELYFLDYNSLNKGLNKRKKRLFDIVMSTGVLITLPVVFFIYHKPLKVFLLALKVLSGKISWVTIKLKEDKQHHLNIKEGVFTPCNILTNTTDLEKHAERLNLSYARNYNPLNDLKIVLKNLGSIE